MNNKILKIKDLDYLELKYSKQFHECSQKHYHNLICFLALKKGSAKIVIEDKEVILNKECLVVINPNEVHFSISNEKSEDYFVIYIDRTWYKDLQNLIYKNNDIFLLPNKIDDKKLLKEFFSLFSVLNKQNESIKKELLLLEFLKELFVNYTKKDEFIKLDNTTQIAKDFKEYIEKNIASKLTLSKIAKELGYSPYHIIRVCNHDFGLSANAYIVNKRVHRAKKLISQGVEISKVALEVGFYDQSHLTNVFKKVFAITPKAYQKEIRNNEN
ncbi:AraC family transcriptional regulator [Malaciobacter sp. WC5094]